ncbi:MAG: hypothetical protein ACHP78_09170 [Terriglobales bacterium]
MDKQLIERLLDAIELLTIENWAYQSLFTVLKRRMPPESQWKAMLEQAKTSPEVRGKIQQQLAPVRERIRQSVDLTDAIQEFLRVVPAKKDVN